MCLDLTGPDKARTWIQQEISSTTSSTLCKENDQTLKGKGKQDRASPRTTQGKGIVGMGQLCCVYCLVPNTCIVIQASERQ